MKTIDTVSKIRILRRMMETVMWEWSAVREGRWEALPAYREQKEEILKEMSGYEWTPSFDDEESTELMVLQSQIVDLESQLQKMVENRMDIISGQLDGLRRRSVTWNKAVNPYRHAIASSN